MCVRIYHFLDFVGLQLSDEIMKQQPQTKEKIIHNETDALLFGWIIFEV